MTHTYDYPSTFAVKILVRKGTDVLLVREPEDNEWMPGRLGLPGGKLILNETIEEGIKRKIATEIDLEVSVKGLVKLIDIIMPAKTVYMLIVAADYVAGEINTAVTESNDIRWYSSTEVENLTIDDCTEYYLPKLLKTDMQELTPLSFIHIQDNRQAEVKDWMEKGQK